MIVNVTLRGAEAILIPKNENTLVKRRVEKKYRAHELDLKIRKLRTRSEFKIMRHLSANGVHVPHVFNIDESKFEFELERLPGILLRVALQGKNGKEELELCAKAGAQVAKMHRCEVAHGDCTTSNLLVSPSGAVFIIDFGLSEMTKSSEERALDLQLFKKTVTQKQFNAFLNGYRKEMSDESKAVLERLENIEKRGRYKKR